MRWLRQPHDEQRRPRSVRRIERGSRPPVRRRSVPIALLGPLFLMVACGPPRAVVVPNEWLSTWTIQSEPVQTETAAPFMERIDLRTATLRFPDLTGVVTAFHAPWLGGRLQESLSLDTRAGLQVDPLPAITPAENSDDAAPSTGARVAVAAVLWRGRRERPTPEEGAGCPAIQEPLPWPPAHYLPYSSRGRQALRG